MNISDCYSLEEVEVNPARLMLDPNNPRLSSQWDISKSYPESAIRSDKLQAYIYKEILKSKYRVKKLIESITSIGFIRGPQPMIVKGLGSTKKYVVLEGNRRTAAIRYLLSEKNGLANGIVKSIKSIPVQVFDYKPNEHYKEDEIIDVLLGTIHVEGTESWGAMEKAHYVYKGYVRELIRKHGKTPFLVDSAVIKSTCKSFNLKPGGIKKVLGIYRVFQQLQKNKYEVNADDYSLIELAITRKVARDEFFEFDTETLKMPATGLDHFSTLCLDRGAPVQNPQDFNAFCYVLANGTEYEISLIVDEGLSPGEVKLRTRRRVEKRVFVEKLGQIKEDIEQIKPVDFRATVEEKKLIKQIEKLVLGKLCSLTINRKASSAKPK